MSDSFPWLGLDIGGANIKAAHTSQWSESASFPLWRFPDNLGTAVAQVLEKAPAFVGIALTMTGELADCYQTRAEGVARILEQVTNIVPASMVQVYGVDSKWRSVSAAARDPWMVAASNWHALASYVSQSLDCASALLIDIGSTTTDLIPMIDGRLAIAARTDSQRMQCGALVYTGTERSNVAAISGQVPLHGSPCPVMNELFATSMDVHLWLGDREDSPDRCDTADGKPATRSLARYRLARIVGEDGSTLADDDIDAIAQKIRRDQSQLIADAMQKVWAQAQPRSVDSLARGKNSRTNKKNGAQSRSTPEQIIVCGQGDFLVEDAISLLEWSVPRKSWKESFGLDLSRSAPAYAVAKLAQMQMGGGS